MKKEFITHGEQETFKTGEELGASVKQGDIFALYGDLGTGKTILAKGIARGLGIEEEITSPTFLLLEIHKGRIPMYHFDLYRIGNSNELDEYGFDEYWHGDGVSVIEWADKTGDTLPSSAIKIFITRINNMERKIIIEYTRD